MVTGHGTLADHRRPAFAVAWVIGGRRGRQALVSGGIGGSAGHEVAESERGPASSSAPPVCRPEPACWASSGI